MIATNYISLLCYNEQIYKKICTNIWENVFWEIVRNISIPQL